VSSVLIGSLPRASMRLLLSRLLTVLLSAAKVSAVGVFGCVSSSAVSLSTTSAARASRRFRLQVLAVADVLQ
jgi:hypothetical protein